MRSPHIDAQTAAYMIEARPRFEDLRQAVAQLAGVLVLVASGAHRSAEPALAAPDALVDKTIDGLKALRVTRRARRHHDHLVEAAGCVRSALILTRERLMRPHDAAALDEPLARLREGYRHLESASRTLPGFDVVAFDVACCARRNQ